MSKSLTEFEIYMEVIDKYYNKARITVYEATDKIYFDKGRNLLVVYFNCVLKKMCHRIFQITSKIIFQKLLLKPVLFTGYDDPA